MQEDRCEFSLAKATRIAFQINSQASVGGASFSAGISGKNV